MNVAGQVNLLTAHFCGIDAVDSTALLIKGVLTVGACQQGSMRAGRASAGVRHPAVCGGACRSNATPTVRPGLQSLARSRQTDMAPAIPRRMSKPQLPEQRPHAKTPGIGGAIHGKRT